MIANIALNLEEVEKILAEYREKVPIIDELDAEKKKKLAWMISTVEEVVGIEHIVNCMLENTSMAGDGVIRCYVGFEPSGKAHIGWKVVSIALRRMLDSGINVLIFMADWHAWVNDKFDGNMESITITAQYMEDTFRTLLDNPPEGDGEGELRFLYASELANDSDYWAKVIRCAKGSTLAQARKTLTIMGRKENEADSDLSKFFYPAMQAADIFEMKLDIAMGGMDQRKAHMYMRNVGDRYKWSKATCIHTPIISNLKASGSRMESFDHKMSKSDPSSSILLHDSPEKIRKKIRSKAYLDPNDPHSPVYEILQYVIIPEYGEITVTPKPEYGEPTIYHSVDTFRKAVMGGKIHPLDAKFAVADALNMGLIKLNEYFEQNPGRLDEVTKLTG